MPYHLEKGAWLTLLEDYVNGSGARALAALRALRTTTPLTELDFVASPALDGDPDYPTLDARRGHLARDWFGREPDGTSSSFIDAVRALLPDDSARADFDARVEPQPEDPRQAALAIGDAAIRAGLSVPFPNTGFWHRYHGDVEGIVRATLECALEVAFGVDRETEPNERAIDSRLPIEIFWKCPQRWFEGWVTWRYDRDTGAGQVTVLLATPGSGRPVLERPLAGQDARLADGPDAEGQPPSELPATPSPLRGANAASKGMWVVSHRDHVLLPNLPASRASRAGQWLLPSFGPAYVGVGSVEIVSPSEADGGVAPFGRSFVEAVDA
ncbi:MAG: hypothetical protein ACRD0G_10365 [Acidimicrobiales bacterium]